MSGCRTSLAAIVRVYGPDLLRYKACWPCKGCPRVIIQGVHELMGASAGRSWESGSARESVMVFIGRDLPREIIEQGLRQSLHAA